MAATSIPNKQQVSTSHKTRSNIPLSGDTVTTMDFGVTNVSFFQEILPSDKIKGHINTFVQLAPMVVPTFSRANLYSRAFFVPYRFIWNGFEKWSEGKRTNLSMSLSSAPKLDALNLSAWFFGFDGEGLPDIGYSTDLYEVIDPTTTKYDFGVAFAISESSPYDPQYRYVRLTPYGRDIFSILRSIGYVLYPVSNQATSYFADILTDKEKYPCLLPLLALIKVFRDYYVNPNYEYAKIDSLLEGQNGTFTLTNTYISGIFDVLFKFIRYCWFNQDVFTAAWANPELVGYTANFYKAVDLASSIIEDTTGSNMEEILGANSDFITRFKRPNNGALYSISQEGLNILKAVRNMVIRQNAAGGRYIDQLLATHGIKLPNVESRRSEFIGFAQSKLSVSRVDATAAGTDGSAVSQLGDFTGRGIMSGNGDFTYDNGDDFGCIFVINHIVPETHYYQGLNPQLLHVQKEEFWNGDLETTANAPIPYSALYGQYMTALSMKIDAANIGGVFGFSANYWENKVGRDILSGDFLLGSRNTDLESFHTFRELVYAAKTLDPDNRAILSPEFQQMTDDNVESFRKIFNDQTNFRQHFIVMQNIDCNVNRPCYSLNNSLVAELNEHGNDVGKIVTIRPNGQYF